MVGSSSLDGMSSPTSTALAMFIVTFEAGEISYYTSGRNGLGLLYLDIDAHQPWQTDEYQAKAILQELFPFGYFRCSRRGQNGYLKIRYGTHQKSSMRWRIGWNRPCAVLSEPRHPVRHRDQGDHHHQPEIRQSGKTSVHDQLSVPQTG